MSAYRLVILALLAAICALSSAASTVHHVRFAQPEILMVWEDGALKGQGDRIDLIGVEAVESSALPGSGELVGVSETLGQSKVISIASNTGLAIRASNTDADHAVSVRIIAIGENAQVSERRVLGDKTTVFELSDRTAVRRGSPESQAITLEIEWSGTEAPNLYVTPL